MASIPTSKVMDSLKCPKVYGARINGGFKVAKSIEELVGKVGSKLEVEVFELQSIGFYRQKFEVEKVELGPRHPVEKKRRDDDDGGDDDEGYDI